MNDYPKRDYSNARRQYEYFLYKKGYNFREIGERLGVSPSAVWSVVRAMEASGEEVE